LGKLANEIFIKESRFTWVTEQKVRFDYTMSSFDVAAPENIGEFLDRYNEDIETLILVSNGGFAAEIDQGISALEKHEQMEFNSFPTGVQDLKNLSKEHDNFFNRLLAFFH